jgi:hypothetical protein
MQVQLCGKIGACSPDRRCVASDIEGTPLVGMDRKAFHPHLVCSWTLDPTSRRLSCAWAEPAERLEAAFLSSRIAMLSLSA